MEILYQFVLDNIHTIWRELKHCKEITSSDNYVFLAVQLGRDYPIIMQWLQETTIGEMIILDWQDYSDIYNFKQQILEKIK